MEFGMIAFIFFCVLAVAAFVFRAIDKRTTGGRRYKKVYGTIGAILLVILLILYFL